MNLTKLDKQIIKYRKENPKASFRDDIRFNNYPLENIYNREKKLKGYGYFMMFDKSNSSHYNNTLFTAKELGYKNVSEAINVLGNGDLNLGRNKLQKEVTKLIKRY